MRGEVLVKEKRKIISRLERVVSFPLAFGQVGCGLVIGGNYESK